MGDGEVRQSLGARLLSAVLSIPLRFKITIPYLIVAVLLAGLATWLVSQTFARTLQERFRGQLVESFSGVSDSIFEIEANYLSAIRAIARTQGVPGAVVESDVQAIERLVLPLAANSHISYVHLLDKDGQPVFGAKANGAEFLPAPTADFAGEPAVQAVLSGASDSFGDKFSQIAETPWGVMFYIVGPIKDGDRLVGAVMAGVPLADLVPELISGSINAVTIYSPDGQVAATTLAHNDVIPALDMPTVSSLNESGRGLLQNRIYAIESREMSEALGPLILRGEPSGWFMGVTLPRSLQAEGSEVSPTELAGWFTLGVLAVIGLGVVVAQLVAIPVFELVRASSQVADGKFDVQVRELAQDELGVLSQRFNVMVQELKQRQYMRELFGRVVSEDVREALLAGQISLGGELKTVTILFTDIRGFTTLSESGSPQEVVNLLNNYFSVINKVIHETGGLVNKFGGDSTLAIYGAPVSLPPAESARRALEAALLLRERLAEFNDVRQLMGQTAIRIGIGINTGEVVTGNIGSEERFEYTVIGDTVNVASRVQSLTQDFTETNILITDSTLMALGHSVVVEVIDYGEMALKGKQQLVRVYGVLDMQSKVPPPDPVANGMMESEITSGQGETADEDIVTGNGNLAGETDIDLTESLQDQPEEDT